VPKAASWVGVRVAFLDPSAALAAACVRVQLRAG
ncbi:hypothetical protein HYH03_018947, partial [Edaphochlamys debaryana]